MPHSTASDADSVPTDIAALRMKEREAQKPPPGAQKQPQEPTTKLKLK